MPLAVGGKGRGKNGDRNREREGAEDGAPLQAEGVQGERTDSKVGPSSSFLEKNSRGWPSLG